MTKNQSEPLDMRTHAAVVIAERLISDVENLDSFGNNKTHFSEMTHIDAFRISKEILNGASDTCSVSICLERDGGHVTLFDGVDEFYCRKIFSWSN